MKRKVQLVDFVNKQNDAVQLLKDMTPKGRTTLLFELIELSQSLMPSDANQFDKKTSCHFVVLKKKSESIFPKNLK